MVRALTQPQPLPTLQSHFTKWTTARSCPGVTSWCTLCTSAEPYMAEGEGFWREGESGRRREAGREMERDTGRKDKDEAEKQQ